jgi:hypothetical protein
MALEHGFEERDFAADEIGVNFEGFRCGTGANSNSCNICAEDPMIRLGLGSEKKM